jgi:hypothetical protein
LSLQQAFQFLRTNNRVVTGTWLWSNESQNAWLGFRQALQAAIAIAEQQGMRSFGLRAALSLAKLYQSTGRPADAHAVLVPALEGFSPTPEMPEIEEAEELLAAWSARDGSARR